MKDLTKQLLNSRRILIQGSAGAGKSAFSRELSELLSIPVIHMDQHYWQPNWTKPEPQDWYKRQLELYDKKEWIIEGGAYRKTLPIRTKASDFVIYLDFNRFFCLYRCFKRYFQYRGRTRPDLAEGCNEQVDYSFAKWILHEQPDIYGPLAIQTIKDNLEHDNFVLLKSKRQLDKFKEELLRNIK